MATTLISRRFTVDEYDRMAEVGILGSDERVELLDGEIVRMAPIGSRHAACVTRLDRIFQAALGNRVLVRVQNPVRLSDLSEPEPDIAVVRSRSDYYVAAHPRPEDVHLVVEVADTTVDKDREVKAPLYAAAGIHEYWLVDVEAETIEVYREPEGGAFREVTRHRRGDVVRPIAFPGLEIRVGDVLS